jgi:acetyl esterase/lipase
MEKESPETTNWTAAQATPNRGRIRTRRFIAFLAVVVTLPVLLIAVGALFPAIPWIGAIGTLFVSSFSLHVVIAGLVGLLLALWAHSLGVPGRRAGSSTIAFLALIAVLGALVPLVAMVRAAHRYGATISWGNHLRVAAPGPRATPDQTQIYTTVDGKPLSLDIYLPPSLATLGGSGATSLPGPLSAPVVMIHGGGYSGGSRSDGRNWDRWLASRGYTVFDIEYRLDPPETWNLAAPDAMCAMSWVAAHAADYHVSPDRMLVAGQSAGAGLALQVTYGVLDGTFASSCGGTVPQPKAVFALYPPDDFAMAWDLNTGIGPAGARKLNTAYIGGSPQQFPDRYRAVSAVSHIRPEFPPTLIAAGEHDHLVPFGGHLEMVTNLNLAGVPNVLVAVPYNDHAYDVAWGSLGSQMTQQALADFLAKYLPPLSSLPPPSPAVEPPQSAPSQSLPAPAQN